MTASGRRALVARRRHRALAVVALVAALAGAAVGSRSGDDGGGSQPVSASRPEPEIACPSQIAADPGRLIGQMLVVRMELTPDRALLRRARTGELGGVVLFPPEDASTAELADGIAALRAAAARGSAPAPLVAIDQEGGEVKRLASVPPDRSPAELARADPAAARRQGEATGRALARLGIDVDLAPVLDLGLPGSFIASRTFGSEPSAVGRRGAAFADGLGTGGVAATAKHFPGLGLASANTDLEPSAIEASSADLAPGLEPFRAAFDSGVALAMVSNATYPAYDRRRPASQSPRVIEGLLRERLDFGGVVITDDLGAGALTGAGIDEGEAAVGAARAGADLLLFALSDGEAAATELRRALRQGRLDRGRLLAACARITALRSTVSSPRSAP